MDTDKPDKTGKPTKDDLDLVAAALGLRSSVWAKAVVHITEPEFNFAINGEIQPGSPDYDKDAGADALKGGE